MPKRRNPNELPDPDDVLSGRVTADVRTLARLIHGVNPTGRGLGAGRTAERYALKSRLQSLLILQCGEDLEVRSDPTREGVVSLRHRYLGVDAGHAILEDLDPDARSAVQFRLDTDGDAPPRPPTGRNA